MQAQVTVSQAQMGQALGVGGAHTQPPQSSGMKPIGQHELFWGLHGIPLVHAPHWMVCWHWSSIVVLHADCRDRKSVV